MKVGLLIDRPSRALSGTGLGAYAQGLARSLASSGAFEDIVLLTPGRVSPAAAVSGIRMATYARNRRLALAGAVLCGRPRVDPSSLRLDLVHVLAPTHPFSMRVPFVATVHDLMPLRIAASFSPPARYLYRRALEKIRRDARCIIASSRATRNDLQTLLDIEDERVRVVYPGLPPHFAAPGASQVAEARKRFGLEGRLVVLFVGEITVRKNVAGLVEGYAQIAARHPDSCLLLVGQAGRGSEEVRDRIRRHRLEAVVRVTGRLDQRTLCGLMGAADVFVLPSLWEGFGFPALEAMACGVPVIASRTASLPEVLGKAGILVDPLAPEEIGEAISRVLSDKHLRSHLADLGRKRAQHFSWEAAARETVDIYRSVLAA